MLRAFMHSTGARLNTKGRYGRPVSKCWNYRCNRLWMEDSTMDLQNMDLQGGSLQISTEVVGKIARCAALEVDGVAEVSCGVQNKKLKSLLESSSIQPPVVVEMRDGTASITLHLMMKFGARIPSVAEKVQENVKSAVQNMTNVTVSRVNLVIAGLAAEEQE